MHEGDDSGLAPARIRRVARESAVRLGVERIDRYLVHEPDPSTPLAATLSALEELVSDGLIGAIGLSNVDGAYLADAIELAPIAVVQNEYSLLARNSGARRYSAVRRARNRLRGVQPACGRLAHGEVPRATRRSPRARG